MAELIREEHHPDPGEWVREALVKTRWKALSLALSGCLLPLSATANDSEKIAALEQRIVRLEAALAAVQADSPQLETAKPAGVATAVGPAGPAAATAPRAVTLNMPNAAPGTQFFFSGFFKLDGLLSRSTDGELADGAIGRDLYVPGLTPVGGRDEGTDLDLHAKFSRLIFGTDSTLDDGRSVQTRFEGDFFGNGLGDERFNNAAGFVVRHAYVNFNNQWLIGQNWTTFMDASTLPESTDLIGPTDGTVFVRQPQVRYTRGPLMFALENPETTITPFGGGTRISSDDNTLPDLVVRFNHKTAAGSTLGIATILRELRLQTTGTGALDDRELGWGLSAFGKIALGQDDLRFAVTGGRGLGRYMGLNLANDAVLDASGELAAVDGVFGYLGYRHLFNAKWRGNLFYARADIDNPAAGGGLQTRTSQSLHANLFYSPFPKWDVGSELIYARRDLENGASGDLIRLHASVKYSF